MVQASLRRLSPFGIGNPCSSPIKSGTIVPNLSRNYHLAQLGTSPKNDNFLGGFCLFLGDYALSGSSYKLISFKRLTTSTNVLLMFPASIEVLLCSQTTSPCDCRLRKVQ